MFCRYLWNYIYRVLFCIVKSSTRFGDRDGFGLNIDDDPDYHDTSGYEELYDGDRSEDGVNFT